MVELINSQGRIKYVSENTVKALKGKLGAWRINDKTVKTPYKEPKQPPPSPPSPPTRDDMVEYLKSQGVKVHWNLSDEKLIKRYNDEKSIH